MDDLLRSGMLRVVLLTAFVLCWEGGRRHAESQEIDRAFRDEKVLRAASPWILDSSFRAVAVSPSGRLLAAFSALRELCVWERSSGRVLLKDHASLPNGVSQLLFLEQEVLVAAGLDGKLLVFNLKTPEKPEISEWPVWNPKDLGGLVSPTWLCLSGTSLYVARDRQIVAMDSRGGKVMRRTEVPAVGPLACDLPIRALTISPDGMHLYTAADHILEWDAPLGAPTSKRSLKGRKVCYLAVSGDGRKLLSGGEDGGIEEWDLNAPGPGVPLFADKRPGIRVLALAYGASADQAYAAFENGEMIRIEAGQVSYRSRVSDRSLGAATIVPTQGIALAGQSGIHPAGQGGTPLYRMVVWDPSTGSDLASPPLYRLFVNKKGDRLVAVSSSEIFLWSRPTAEAVRLPRPPEAVDSSPLISPVVMDSSGVHVYVGQRDGSIAGIGVAEGKPLRRLKVRRPIYSLALSEDGTMLASGSDQGVDLVDLGAEDAPPRLINLSPDHLTGIAVSRDGSILAVGRSGEKGSSLELWGGRSGELLSKVETDDGTPRIRFGVDERDVWIANGSRTLYHWRSKEGVLDRIPIARKLRMVLPVDPRRMVVACEGSLLLADLRSGKILEESRTYPDVITDLGFASETNTLLASWGDGSLRSWTLNLK